MFGLLRDHPRSRGGNRTAAFVSQHVTGPSPLARGKPSGLPHGQLQAGTIPARAGETVNLRSQPTAVRDHPRSRGGNARPVYARSSEKGPSPLARGKPICVHSFAVVQGTIPARAGETKQDASWARWIRDHPRSRGGNQVRVAQVRAAQGPSPLARGKLARQPGHRDAAGTIPARAGETLFSG